MRMTNKEDEVPVSEDELTIPSATVLNLSIDTDDLCTSSSCDEAEFSAPSSTGSSEKDFPLSIRKKTRNGIETDTGVSDLGYDSSTSTDGDIEDQFGCLPHDLKILVEGLNHGLPSLINDDPPDWYDPVKFKTGQTFAMKYYFGVNFAEMISLFILFSFDDSLKPLIFTNQSGTPLTSFKRYLSTVLRVKSWYENDLFNDNNSGYNNVRIVRAMHSNVSRKMNSVTRVQVEEKIQNVKDSLNLVCPLKGSIGEDFGAMSCPFLQQQFQRKIPGSNSKMFFNQFSMSVTQFGFLGLVILHPEKFGAAGATDEELEGFIHLWKVLGYLLGIKDRYNFCNGSLGEVKTRCQDLINYWVIPNFTRLSAEWEHFSQCVVKGVSFYVPGNTFDVSILYLCYVLNINSQKIYSKTSWSTYFRFLFFKFTLCFALKWSWLLDKANWSLRMSLKKAKNYSTQDLSKLESISDDFMRL